MRDSRLKPSRVDDAVQRGIQSLPDTAASQTQIMDETKGLHRLLEDLAAKIRTEKDLTTEIAAQGQQRSEARHELHVTATALKTAESRIIELVEAQRQSMQEAKELKRELAAQRARPVIDPEIPKLLQEQRARVSELQAENSSLQEVVTNASSAAQLQETEAQRLQTEVNQLKEWLQEREETIGTLAQHKETQAADTEKAVEDMRLLMLNGVENEKSRMNVTMARLREEHKTTREKLEAEQMHLTADIGRLKDSLEISKKREAVLDGELGAAQKSNELSASLQEDLRTQMQREQRETELVQAELHTLKEAEKKRDIQLLERLNLSIQANGGSCFQNVEQALDFLLARGLRPLHAGDEKATDSIQVAKTQVAANTAVPRTASRSSELTDFDDAVQLSETLLTPKHADTTLASSITLRGDALQEPSHNRPESQLLASQYRAPGLSDPRKGRASADTAIGNSRSASVGHEAILVPDTQSQTIQGVSSPHQSDSRAKDVQRRPTIATFRSSVGLDKISTNSHALGDSHVLFPTTPTNSPPQRVHFSANQAHSNSSARRLGKACQPMQQPQAPGDDATTVHRATNSREDISTGSKCRTVTRSRATVNGKQCTASTNEAARAGGGAPPILKKRKAEEQLQKGDEGGSRPQRMKRNIEGLGPIINSSDQSQKGSKSAPMTRKTSKRGSQGQIGL